MSSDSPSNTEADDGSDVLTIQSTDPPAVVAAIQTADGAADLTTH
jgi:hypothetical protein